MNGTKEIIKKIENISGRYSPHLVFSDWVECFAITISNSTDLYHDAEWKRREEQYINTMNKYSLDERMEFSNIVNLFVKTLECGMKDILGEIYMGLDHGNKRTGQFFTPYHLSLLSAEMSAANIEPDEKERRLIYEPSCGSGGMIIATASVLKNKGYNYQRIMDVVAQDLDWKCVYMCYVQLSILGISAVVVQGDTISELYRPGKINKSRIFYTPAKKGVLM